MRPSSRPLSHNTCKVQPVTATNGSIDVDSFRSLAWEPAIPVHLRDFHRLPAMNSWITGRDPEKGPVSFGDKLESFSDTVVSYELITSSHAEESSALSSNRLQEFQAWLKTQPAQGDSRLLCRFIDHLLESAENDQSRFLQFDAPLSLIIQASRFNGSRDSPSRCIKQLYIAQSDIRSLPLPLGDDLPVPEIVARAGKGDIYSSSIWLGLQPTYTPLHRDPNPNLFCQLVGSKAVRFLRPRAGLSVFQDVRRSLGVAGNSRFRGPEMMDGPERDGLHRAIWVDPNASREICEAVLSPGDALFIPQGWWHTVRSVGHEAELNASANWWFR
ncbi:hypothetical protein E0Z10_g2435 [Xylaria hypoxylon]|uniref:JmjC domain-containing protein n=1 Tax=Xylaria hypoxylon TaxID=37992 RepID=A0A4Z0ZC95_9PEZI|nr:hypothetical protein E0Z10_g2435 [Xylaria hypoxylon]